MNSLLSQKRINNIKVAITDELKLGYSNFTIYVDISPYPDMSTSNSTYYELPDLHKNQDTTSNSM